MKTDEEQEHHELYARYISIPVTVLRLLRSKEVSPREALLLGLIDGFCNHSRGQACFASNKYLAESLGCGVKNIEAMLVRLTRQKLLTSVTMAVDGKGAIKRRHLIVRWPTRP